MNPPTFGSLFSGTGMGDLGLERAGWECRWQVEIDDWRRAQLEKRWPGTPKFGDIREVRGEELEHVDLVAGGFPCPPSSVAGRRLGRDDPRWLWPQFARILRVVRPRYVLVENPAGLLSVNDGDAMGEVVGDLAALGYRPEWSGIPASALGAPQRRDRVWIVAHCEGVTVGTGLREGKPP